MNWNACRELLPAFAEASENFLLDRDVSGCSKATVASYDQTLRLIVLYAQEFPFPDLDALSTNDMRRYLHYLKHRPLWFGKRSRAKNEGETISSSYYATLFRRMDLFFRWCVRQGLIPENPMDPIEDPREVQKIVHTITDEEFYRIIRLNDPGLFHSPFPIFYAIRNTAVFWIFRDTPSRCTELSALTVDRVHPEHRRIHVTGKGGKERYMYFGDTALAALRRYLDARRALNPGTDALWVDPYGNPLGAGRSWIYSMLKRAGELAEVEGLHPHRFRHTFAVDMIRAGVPVPVVELMGGWSRIPPNYLATIGDGVVQKFQGFFSPADRLVRRTGLSGERWMSPLTGTSPAAPDNWGMNWPPSFAPRDSGATLAPPLAPDLVEVRRQLALRSAGVSPNGTSGDWPPSEHANGPFPLPAGSEGTQLTPEAFSQFLEVFRMFLMHCGPGMAGHPGNLPHQPEMPQAALGLGSLLAEYSRRGSPFGSAQYPSG